MKNKKWKIYSNLKNLSLPLAEVENEVEALIWRL